MKPAIMNLSKWTEATAQAVRSICNKKDAPCVGFALIFFDPMAEEEERWPFCIHLAYDPHDPPPKEERERLEKAFEYISEGVKRIMSGDFTDDLRDYEAHGSFH